MPDWYWQMLKQLIIAVIELLVGCVIGAIIGSTGYFLRQGLFYARARRWSSAWKRWIYSMVVSTLIAVAAFLLHADLTMWLVIVALALMGFFGYFLVPGEDVWPED